MRSSRELLDIRKNLAKLNKLEAYHDALERKEDAQQMFTLGMLDLPDKAKIENLYWEISQRSRRRAFKGQAYVPEEIRKLEDSLGDQYLCNFSVFQSLLDHWALGQLFPIMPVEPAQRTPHARGDAGGHHLRFRRAGEQVHRPARRARHAAAAPAESPTATASSSRITSAFS